MSAAGPHRRGVVVAASRMRHPLEARTLARLAARYAGDDAGDVVGFGLSNDERRGVIADFAPAFAIAGRAGLAARAARRRAARCRKPSWRPSSISTRTGSGTACAASRTPPCSTPSPRPASPSRCARGATSPSASTAPPRRCRLRRHRRGRHTRGAGRRRPAALRHPAGRAVRRARALGFDDGSSQRWPVGPLVGSRAPEPPGRPPSPTWTRWLAGT